MAKKSGAAMAIVGGEKGVTDVLKEAQINFAYMQRSWFLFAKSIHTIHMSKIYEKAGFTSFKEYVETDFPTLSYSVIDKFVHIIESWGEALEMRINRDEEYKIPAYEACYSLIAAEKKAEIPKEELSRIKKAVLDNTISYHRLRDSLREHIDSKRALRSDASIDVDAVEEVENQLAEELRSSGELDSFTDGSEEFDLDDPESPDEDEDFDFDEAEEEVEVEKANMKSDVKTLAMHVDFLLDNLPSYCEAVGVIDEGTVVLAEKLEKLIGILDNFLDHLDEIGKED